MSDDPRLRSGVVRPRRVRVEATVRVDAYAVIADAVEAAVAYGYGRAHKHTDTPTEQAIIEAISDAVMTDLCNVLRFGDDG